MRFHTTAKGNVPFTTEEELDRDAEEQTAAAIIAERNTQRNTYQAKLNGIEFEGVMCSATKEDMWGLAAIKDFVSAGNTTKFRFENGNTLTLTPANYAAFEAIWTPFRASFFL